MKSLRNMILGACALFALASFASVQGDDNKFEIYIGPDKQVFMLNKQSGASWRYFRTSEEKQGWMATEFYNSDGTKFTAEPSNAVGK